MLKYRFSQSIVTSCNGQYISSLRLISTDAAARGIDISGVKCVVNYDAPQYVRTYIHRSDAVNTTAFPVRSTCP